MTKLIAEMYFEHWAKDQTQSWLWVWLNVNGLTAE